MKIKNPFKKKKPARVENKKYYSPENSHDKRRRHFNNGREWVNRYAYYGDDIIPETRIDL